VYKVRCNKDWSIDNIRDLEGSCCGLVEVLLRYFLGQTEENDGKPQSEYRGRDSNQALAEYMSTALTPDQASRCEEVSDINNFPTTDFRSEGLCSTVNSK
jgi:hypothetical protein